MKTETLIKRMNDRRMLTKTGKLIAWYEKVEWRLDALANGKRIYPFVWSHTQGRNKLEGYDVYNKIYDYICSVELGNDAPKGGKEGDYIGVPKKEIRKFKGWLQLYKTMRNCGTI